MKIQIDTDLILDFVKIVGFMLACIIPGWISIELFWNNGNGTFSTFSTLPLFWGGMIYYHYLNKWKWSKGNEKTKESVE